MMEAQLLDSDSCGVEQATAAGRDSRLMRSVNRRMRELADALAYADPIIFFCECQTLSCYSPIAMSAEDFDAAVTRQTGWLLRAGHQPSALWDPRDSSAAAEVTSPVEGLGAARREMSQRAKRRWIVSLRRRLAVGSSALENHRNVADLEETIMEDVCDA